MADSFESRAKNRWPLHLQREKYYVSDEMWIMEIPPTSLFSKEGLKGI